MASLVVLGKTTKVTLKSSGASKQVGVPIDFTAVVADKGPGAKTQPTGEILWSDGGMGGNFSDSVCILVGQTVSSSACSVTYTPVSPGKITVTATYSGDAQHKGSLQKTVAHISRRPTRTTIQASVAIVPEGGSVMLNGTVTDVGTGAAVVPSGLLTWVASKSGGAFTSVSCVLIAINSTTSGCAVTYTAPLKAGTVSLKCEYVSDLAHKVSSAKFALKVS
jgi:hypothetical protein